MKRKLLAVLALCLMLMLALAVSAGAVEAKAAPQLVMPKTVEITAGLKGSVTVFSMSDGSAVPADVVYTIASNKTKFATVDATGAVSTFKAGTAVVTASSATLGKSANAKCTVKILKNEISRSGGPYKGDGSRGIFWSTKRLYFKDGKLQGEWYVFNRYFTYSLDRIEANAGGLAMVLVDSRSSLIVGAKAMPTVIKLGKRVAYNKVAVVKVTFEPTALINGLDLRSGNYYLNLMGNYDFWGRNYVKGGATESLRIKG